MSDLKTRSWFSIPFWLLLGGACWPAALTANPELSPFADDASNQWQQERDRNGISVHTKSVEGSPYRAVKAVMRVNASLSELVALVQDSTACKDWAAHCKSSEIVAQQSPTEMLVYTLNDLPWPVANRDAVTRVVWQQDPETLTVTMSAKIVAEESVPKKKGAVRLQQGVTSWEFAPAGEGQVQVISKAHIDPEGATPAWLTNQLLVGAPFDTMAAMRKLVESGAYAQAKVGFIAEP